VCKLRSDPARLGHTLPNCGRGQAIFCLRYFTYLVCSVKLGVSSLGGLGEPVMILGAHRSWGFFVAGELSWGMRKSPRQSAVPSRR
jgi:hypothetical protein